MMEKRSRVYEENGVGKVEIKNQFGRVLAIYSFPIEFLEAVSSKSWSYVSGYANMYFKDNGRQRKLTLGYFIKNGGKIERQPDTRVVYIDRDKTNNFPSNLRMESTK